MSLNASGWSIRHPLPTLVLFLVLTLAGILSFSQLGIDANPNIDLPYISIETTSIGAGPQELETQFTKKVENAVAGLSDVEEIYSAVADGYAYTNVRFALSAERDRTLDDVRDAIDRIRQELAPYNEGMTIQRLRYDDDAVLTYAIRSPNRSIEDLSDWVDRTIAPELMSVQGVAEVRRIGGVDREISVDLDPYQLDAYGVSAVQVNSQVKDFNVNLPGGRSQVAGQEQTVRAIGKFPNPAASLAALKQVEITSPTTGSSVSLSELAAVTDGFAETRQSAMLNGEPVVSFAIFRGNGSLLVSVEDGVKDAIARLENSTLPKDIQLQLIFTRATDIRAAYKASIEALILGSILAVVVVGSFLRNWRTTLITAAALPLSIIPTFIVINALGYSLNSMTLLALTLAVGNLVDDAIVEIENVERHLQMGKSPTQAALDSSAEVGLAVITTTATIVAVFIPVAFMGGIPGQFFKPFGVTVAVSTMFSTLVARLITPLLASKLLQPVSFDEGEKEGASHFYHSSPSLTLNHSPVGRVILTPSPPSPVGSKGLGDEGSIVTSTYARLLRTSLRHRLVTLSVAIGIFIASLSLIPHLPTGLYGVGNTNLSQLSLELPPGTTFEKTQALLNQLSDRLQTHPAVDSIYINQQITTAEAVIRLKPENQRQLSRQEFEQQVRSQLQTLPDLRFNFSSQGASGSEKALNIVLKSANTESLNQSANQLAQQMRQLPGLVEVSTSTGLIKPQLLIIPNPQQAVDRGVTLRDIATTATIATLGDTDSTLAEIEADDQQIPIRVRLSEQFRANLETLKNLQVSSAAQQLVPLSAVANVVVGGGPAEIKRFDRERQVTVSANLEGLPLGQALDAVYALPALQNLPSDVTEQATGDADILQDVFSRFTLALATAIVMIYAVLVLLYNSFIYPLAVMSALPLSIGGTFVALLLTQKPLDLYALIGIVLLMGLVTKNSILLVDYALQGTQKGLPLKQAVIESGTTRMRPILMTSISTVAGMVPIALELGAGGEVRSPMAIAVIGGFTTATLLTLVVVPVCFTYIAGFQQHLSTFSHWIAQLFNRRAPKSARFSSAPPMPALAYATAAPIQASPTSSQSAYARTTDSQQQTQAQKTTSLSSESSLTMSTQLSPNLTTLSNAFDSVVDASPTAPQQTDSLDPTDSSEQTYTIACIENDLTTLCQIHEYLNDTVFSVVSVEDPVIALTDLTLHRPDIILMTTSMPGLDGFAVCDRLRKSYTFRQVPIILLSPNLSWWQSLKAKWYGATTCLSKPLDRTQLLIQLFLLMV
ncbi:MAG: efflux RND transporter permease subunit [Cyanobacteria bacterium J06627_28]